MDTLDTILQAAYELFSERGFERTPVSDIAKRAKVAAGTVIYHFKTKENLLRVLNWFTINRLYSDIRDRTLKATNGLQATYLYVDQFFVFLSANRRETALLLDTYSRSTELGDGETLNMDINIKTIRHGLGSLLETLIREGRADGSIRNLDERLAGLGILSLLLGSARMALSHNVPETDLLAAAREFVQARLAPVETPPQDDFLSGAETA